MGSGVTKSYYNDNLLSAASDGTASHLEKLVDAGANVNCRNLMNGWTPLHFACRAGNVETAEWLLQNGADRTLLNSDSKTAEEVAQRHEKENVLGLFFSDLNDSQYFHASGLLDSSSETLQEQALNKWNSDISPEGALTCTAIVQEAEPSGTIDKQGIAAISTNYS